MRSTSNILLLDEQTGLRKGLSCINHVFSLKILIRKTREFNFETHLAFIDYEKPFGRVNIRWDSECKRGDSIHLVDVVN